MKNIAILIAFLIATVTAAVSAVAAESKPGERRQIGDWVLQCTKMSGGADACALHQKILASDTRHVVAAVALARNDKSHELRMTVVLPLGLDIPAGVSGKAGTTPLLFTMQTCVKRGCIASAQVDDRLLETLRGAGALSITFKMRIVADPTTVPISLKGLDEGLKALEAK